MKHFDQEPDPAEDWRQQAACAQTDDPELFYPKGRSAPYAQQTEEARSVCRGCPVLSVCLAYALNTRQEFGVWGGMDEHERMSLRRRALKQARRAREKAAA